MKYTVFRFLTDSVDVVLAVVGVVVVYGELDVVHVQPTGSNVSGHQDIGGAGPEKLSLGYDKTDSQSAHLIATTCVAKPVRAFLAGGTAVSVRYRYLLQCQKHNFCNLNNLFTHMDLDQHSTTNADPHD